jgi:hypothetical protein
MTFPVTASTVFVAWGNSLVAGTGASDSAHAWPGVLNGLSPLAGTGVTISQSGIPGQTLTTTNIYDGSRPKMLDTGVSMIDPVFQAGRTVVLCVEELTNELQSNGANPTACLASLATVLNARRAAAAAVGCRLLIVGSTCPPGAYQPPGQAEVNVQVAAQNATNVLLRANWRLYYDALADIAAYAPLATIFANGNYSTTAFAASGCFTRTGGQGDGQPIDYLHVNNATYAVFAQTYSDAINSLGIIGTVAWTDYDTQRSAYLGTLKYADSDSQLITAFNAKGGANLASVAWLDVDQYGVQLNVRRAAKQRTVRDLIRRSLRLIGAYGSGESIDANDAMDAMFALNQLVDGWSTDNLMVYETTEVSFPLVAGKAMYSIGPFADFDTPRPVALEYAFTRDAQGLDRPLRNVSQEDYATITLKNIGETFPWAITNDMAQPLSTLTLYPYPQAQLTLFLGIQQAFKGFQDLSDPINLPPGYEEALVYSLAEQIAPEYDRPIPPVVSRTAAMARGRIRSVNLPSAYMAVEFTGVGAMTGNGDAKAAFLAGY